MSKKIKPMDIHDISAEAMKVLESWRASGMGPIECAAVNGLLGAMIATGFTIRCAETELEDRGMGL